MSTEKYYFEIPAREKIPFTDAVEKLTGSYPCFSTATYKEDGHKYYYYFLDLTKYDLVYLRLAVKNGSYVMICIPDAEQTHPV